MRKIIRAACISTLSALIITTACAAGFTAKDLANEKENLPPIQSSTTCAPRFWNSSPQWTMAAEIMTPELPPKW